VDTVDIMKAGIKRIEATLHDLEHRPAQTESNESNDPPKPSLSFRIGGTPQEETATTSPTPQEICESPADDTDVFIQHESVQAFSVSSEFDGKTPDLPKFKPPVFNSHRNGANPALSINLLQEIQQIVTPWQVELQTIIRQIQDIYLEGPIVNGWLESQTSEPATGTATLRHGEVDQLMNYVEEICKTQTKTVSKDGQRTGYRLCGLDAAGKVWTRPCPPEQVAGVSMAIARYQKLRQLLTRKQSLETRLGQLAETLIMLHSHLKSQ
jgi:hypothetical protein